MTKRTHSNRKTSKFKAGAVLAQPSSPAGQVRSKKGKVVNLGLTDPVTPSWKTGNLAKPFRVPFRFGT